MKGFETILLVLASLASSALMIMTGIRLFQKAGIPGWRSLVPIMSSIDLFDIMSSSDNFWFMVFTGTYILFLGEILPLTAGLIKWTLIALGSLICLCFQFDNYIKGAKRFGKTDAFAIGMLFLPIIFFPILAFGDAVYDAEA